MKGLKTTAAKIMSNPLIPHDVRAALADAVQLIGEIVERVEKLESKQNGQS